jgi:SAM-dependent methyltransferase
VDARLRNLNLVPYQNVEVVGDAHCLPFATESVGALHCEAVLEHLRVPGRAVCEMFRVLRPAGYLFAATPFLQSFHGYPDHYQNYTLAGHRELFTTAGFEIVDSGPCVGPAFAAVDLTSNWLRELVPGRLLSRSLWLGVRIAGRVLVQLDRLLLRSKNSHMLASSTFVLAQKPK